MKNDALNMSEGSILKKLIVFAIPIMFGNLFQQLYNIVDSLIVGNFVGTKALAAISSSSSLIFLLVGFFNGLAMGASVIVARYFGENNDKDLHESIHTMMAVGIVAGILLTVLGVFGSKYILILMNTPKSILDLSILYFKTYFMGSLFFVMYNVMVGILQSVGDSRSPLKYLIMSSFVNVVLDLIFVIVFKMGVFGAGLATVISQFISFILCFYQLTHVNSNYCIDIRKIKFHSDKLKLILEYGLPSGLQNCIISIANVIVQSNINGFGKAAVAGIGSYSKIEGFAFLPIKSFSMAITTFVSQNIGAKKFDRVKKGSISGIICSMCLAETIGILFFIFAKDLVSMFGSDPIMVNYGVARAKTNTLFFMFLAFTHGGAAVLRGLGKPVVSMGIMAICWCVIRVILLNALLFIDHDINMVYWVYPITWMLSSIAFVFCLYKYSHKVA